MEYLFEKLKAEMQIQLQTQTDTLTEKLNSKLDEKLQLIFEENQLLKSKIEVLETKVHSLERETRRNNLILHGIKENENEKNNHNLMDTVLKVLNDLSKNSKIETWDKWEISMVRRLGKKIEGRTRPVLVSLTLTWRKSEILKNNKKFLENIYATEDLPRDVLLKRKELKKTVEDERAKGNFAFIRYDKVIIKGANEWKENKQTKVQAEKTREEKRKRITNSPNSAHLPNPKTNKTEEGGLSKGRSFSMSERPIF